MALSDGVTICAEDLAAIVQDVLSADPDAASREAMGLHLRYWDVLQGVAWAAATAPLSAERRSAIYSLLDIAAEHRARFDEVFPIARPSDTQLIIAESHQPWYSVERAAAHRFYWEAYKRYLRNTANWPPGSVEVLDVATTLIVERLSDPERVEIYSTKGLVVGYVQSGKTANFTAVIAKAADAGYRLMIILAGTLNILREQAQRRLDKELIGRELIVADQNAGGGHDYEGDRDWDKFVRYGALPNSLGSFNWERLTGAVDDYQRLRKGIRALEFPKRPDRRFNHPENLHSAP
ncbi:MAG: hypothetical protein L0Z55_11280, partial [Planctomycetes bacterium]|nr:hypothetical protein [Planctomycetota bacterium]